MPSRLVGADGVVSPAPGVTVESRPPGAGVLLRPAVPGTSVISSDPASAPVSAKPEPPIFDPEVVAVVAAVVAGVVAALVVGEVVGADDVEVTVVLVVDALMTVKVVVALLVPWPKAFASIEWAPNVAPFGITAEYVNVPSDPTVTVLLSSAPSQRSLSFSPGTKPLPATSNSVPSRPESGLTEITGPVCKLSRIAARESHFIKALSAVFDSI
jgi:hypothetical protein